MASRKWIADANSGLLWRDFLREQERLRDYKVKEQLAELANYKALQKIKMDEFDGEQRKQQEMFKKRHPLRLLEPSGSSMTSVEQLKSSNQLSTGTTVTTTSILNPIPSPVIDITEPVPASVGVVQSHQDQSQASYSQSRTLPIVSASSNMTGDQDFISQQSLQSLIDSHVDRLESPTNLTGVGEDSTNTLPVLSLDYLGEATSVTDGMTIEVPVMPAAAAVEAYGNGVSTSPNTVTVVTQIPLATVSIPETVQPITTGVSLQYNN